MTTEVSRSVDSKRTDAGFNPNPVPKDNAQETLPRVSTGRVPLLKTVPTEIHLNRYKPVTKSQDETKHITVQKFAHGHILDIGAEIHRLRAQAANKDREKAVVEAENRVWQHAEEIRIKALQELQAKLLAEHEDVLRRIRKEHDKVLKEEALRVETAMRQLSLEQVEIEREEGEKRLQKAVKEVEQRCKREMELRIEQTRAEEREAANAQLEALDRAWQNKYNDIIDQMNADKKRELNNLTEIKDWEKQRAIIQTRQVEREAASNDMKRVQQNYDSRIQVLNHKIQEKEAELRDLKDNKNKSDYQLQEVGKELFTTRDAFREYIHRVCECVPGQADYQMPSTKFKRCQFFD